MCCYTSRLHLFPCNRFHVLFYSLFKVLFNFPSRYLFTIGFVIIFSLRRSLPSLFSVHSQTHWLLREQFNKKLKTCDYGTTTPRGTTRLSEVITVLALLSFIIEHVSSTAVRYFQTYSLCYELFPFHSPLLRKSHLVSLPPLNNMLKFGGYTLLNWEWNEIDIDIFWKRRFLWTLYRQSTNTEKVCTYSYAWATGRQCKQKKCRTFYIQHINAWPSLHSTHRLTVQNSSPALPTDRLNTLISLFVICSL